jgi:hypothetical protein
MYIIPIVTYCLVAALLIFGVTFHDELLKERHCKRKTRPSGSLIVMDGGRRHLAKRHMRP